ncbi:nuclear transport factor 2 family protein [Sphingomonas sp.]|uniref:YybH family protein n=1 Tax=Sphingomonas sp. TaxID=28214 RepID=UPI0025D9937E|nr:nuclear transport factor 2 family protein [Sphingomonas sp.]
MKIILTIATATLAAQPVAAHPGSPHPTAPKAATTNAATESEAAAVRSVLAQYKSANERLDATGTERLFTTDSAIFETGGVEGTYGNYLAHHLTPELAEFKVFRFSDYKIDVRFEGPIALAAESYKYRIETKKGEIAERLGVATSVLIKVGGRWKIVSMHNSARKPKGS